jgi:hypothetical protein
MAIGAVVGGRIDCFQSDYWVLVNWGERWAPLGETF